MKRNAVCSSHFSNMWALRKLTSHLGKDFSILLLSFIYFFLSSLNARQNKTIKLLEILFTLC